MSIERLLMVTRKGDPYWQNVQFLLKCTGSNTFVDASKNGYSIALTNTPVTSTTSPYADGSKSFRPDGASYLTVTKNSNLEMAAGDNFTIETWGRFDSIPGAYAMAFGMNSSDYIGLKGSQHVFDPDGGSEILYGSASANLFYHIAWVRNSGTLTCFINGSSIGSAANSATAFTSSGSFDIGRMQSNYNMAGYVQDLRITKGIARYTANFTPPTKEFPTF
jgi:hypothetical protein